MKAILKPPPFRTIIEYAHNSCYANKITRPPCTQQAHGVMSNSEEEQTHEIRFTDSNSMKSYGLALISETQIFTCWNYAQFT